MDAMESTLFIPVIKHVQTDSHNVQKQALRVLFETLLAIDACAVAVAEYKSNGSKLGHKVLDDSAAVDALIDSSPEELEKQFEAIPLTQWEKCQVLNQVLRRHFELNKKGKLTGAPSKRALRLQQSS